MTSLSRLAGRAVQVLVIHVYRSRFRFQNCFFCLPYQCVVLVLKRTISWWRLSQQQHMFNMIEKKEKKSNMRSCLEALCDGKILKQFQREKSLGPPGFESRTPA